MRNNKQTLLVALCTLLTYSAAMSQVDVTALYLKNAGFDTNYDYKVGVTGNVTQEMLPVDGWINDYSVNYTIVGTYQVKTKKTFNGASVPTTNVDGTTEGGVLALSTGWSESIKLYQNVSLPKGEYSIVTAYYNSGSVTAGNSLFGWIPSSGTSIMSTVSDFPIKKWTVDTLFVKLLTKRSGKIQIGMKAADGGSGSSAKLSIDYIRIFSHTWDGSILTSTLKSANRTYERNTDANGIDDLKAAIDSATIIQNDSTATPEDQVAATVALNEAVEIFETLQDAYSNLQKAIKTATAQLGDGTGYGASDLQSAIDKATEIVNNTEATASQLDAATMELNSAVALCKKLKTAHTNLLAVIDEAVLLYADGTGNGAAELQETINKARQTANESETTSEAMDVATEELKNAIFKYRVLNATGTVPTVTTHHYVARGSTVALGRSTVSGTNLLEQGFCWSTEPNPTVLDNRSTKYYSQSGRIYAMENLDPSTIYYVRAYAMTKDYAVGYGEVKKVITLPAGKVKWTYDYGADAAANERIATAVEDAVNYLNTYTSINGLTTQVHYGSGTPTADCSYGGWMRVGPNASYQRTGTILHELGHAIGVGTHSIWNDGNSPMRAGSGRGDWLGDRATEVLRFLDNSSTAVMTGDGTHMWPYGVNGAHEDNGQPILYICNTLIYQALGEDGLPPTGGFATPAYVFEQEDTIKYYIKNENDKYGLYSSYLVQNTKGYLVWKEMNAATALANDSAAWYITFNPTNSYYQLRNAATGRYITYNGTGTNGIRTAVRSSITVNDNFHLMRSRVDVTVGSDDSEMNLRGYWIIHPEHKLNPTTLVASNKGTVATAAFNLGNAASIQRWLFLTADQAVRFETARISAYLVELDDILERIKGIVAVPHTEEIEGVDAAIHAVVSDIESKRDALTDPEEVNTLIAVAKEALYTFLCHATPIDAAHPFDLTYMIVNAAIDNSEGWSDSPTLSFSCMEYFQKTFDFNQTLISLPAGTYQIRVQAYQRPGNAVTTYADYIAGTNKVTTKLYAGTESKTIQHIASEARTNKLGGDEIQVTDIPPRYVPNNMQAANLYFAKGLYDNALITSVAEDGKNLKIGLKCASSADSYWTIFDNFRIYYYGSIDESIVNGIDAPTSPVNDNYPADVYSVTGVCVRSAATNLEGLPSGLYIVNGKKVWVR